MAALVDLHDVTKLYDSGEGPPALDGVSLSITEGSATVIMGPSGSGKSTLLNLVAGLDRPTHGSIEVAGQELGRLNETALARYRRRTVGLVFQFFNLLDNLTVLDNVLIPADLAGVPRASSRERAVQLLTSLGIVEQAGSYPSRLSGGQRQRVAIGRALINRPQLLLADEPTGALDSASGKAVVALLRDLHRSGQTLVIVTHDAYLAEQFPGRIVTLADGRVQADTAGRERRA